MNHQRTEIVMVVDRSGSMHAIRDDAEGGMRNFIEEQKKAPGEAFLTIIQFNDKPEVVCDAKPINEVAQYTLNPNGYTALLDAVGLAIDKTGARLAAMPEAERPALVVIVVITDGQENSSCEYSGNKIKEMISRQEKDYNWKFVYLNSDLAGFAFGRALGFGINTSAVYGSSGASSRMAYALVSSSLCAERCRAAADKNYVPSIDSMTFSDEDRKAMLDKGSKSSK